MKKYDRIFKEEMMSNYPPRNELEDFFEARTEFHIMLVRKFIGMVLECNELDYLNKNILSENILNHDDSKFENPEYEPYLLISWNHKLRNEGKETLILSEEDKQKTFEATYHHIKNNNHHPEYWSDTDSSMLNSRDRDKPSGVIVDATGMPIDYIALMVCDWMAMSEELGTCPHEWAKNNVNIRWKFDQNQVDTIYSVLDCIWKD